MTLPSPPATPSALKHDGALPGAFPTRGSDGAGAPSDPRVIPPFPFEASQILPWLWLGGHIKGGDTPDEAEYGPDGGHFLTFLTQMGVRHILNVAAEHDDRKEARALDVATFKIAWPDDDLDTPAGRTPYQPPLQDFVAALRWVLGRFESHANRGAFFGVYLHCHSGHFRSPLLATFLVAVLEGMSTLDAYRFVTGRRPTCCAFTMPGWAETCHRAVERVRPLVDPRTPLNALPALDRLLAELPPVLKDLDARYYKWTADGRAEQIAVPPQPRPTDPGPKGPFASSFVTSLLPADPGVPGGASEESYAAVASEWIAPYLHDTLERSTLTAQIAGAMHAAFAARWAELAGPHAPVPMAARVYMGEEARRLAGGHLDDHNRRLARLAVDALRQPGVQVGSPHAAQAVVANAAIAYLRSSLPPRAARLAQHVTRSAQSLADLHYAARLGAGARLAVTRLDADEEGWDADTPAPGAQAMRRPCAICAHYDGAVLPVSQAWNLTFPAHIGCGHAYRVVLGGPN